MLASRYLLRASVGVDAAIDAHYWWATDLRSERDVALTLLHGPSYLAGAEWTNELMNSAVRAEQLNHRGCARLVDVVRRGAADLPSGVIGMAVSDWVPGRSLTAVVAEGAVRPATAVQMVEPIADAAQFAHRQGMVLGCNQIQRIRVTPDRRAVMAFPMPRPETTTDDDVRGLGTALYALLTASWPQLALGLGGRAGRAWTPGRGSRPGIPHELDSLVAGTLGTEGRMDRVCSADVVYEVLADLLASEQDTVLLPPVGDVVTEPEDIWLRNDPASSLTDPDKRRKLGVGLAGLGAGLLTAAGFVGLQVMQLTGGHGSPPMVVPGPPVASSTEVEIADVEVYRIGSATPVDPAATERSGSATAERPLQLPGIGPGVGLMVSFQTPVRLASVSITSPSDGARVELRSAPRIDTPFEQTTPISTTTLRAGVTELRLAGSHPMHHVLLRIVESGAPQSNAAQLDQVVFRKAGGCGQQPQLPYSTSGWVCGR